MEKQFYFLTILAFIIFVVGGIFLWSKYYSEEARDIMPAVKFEPPENYVISTTTEGVFVENKKAGISFKVPDKWTVEKKQIGVNEWTVNILSPDAEVNESGLLIKGCGVSAWVESDETMAEAVRHRMKDPERYSGEISGGYEVFMVDGRPALKMTLEHPEWGQSVAIKIPIKDKIYMFDTRFLPEEIERCSKKFAEFLEGVSVE